MKIYSIIKQVGVRGLLKAGLSELYRKIIREYWYGSYAQDYEDLIIENIVNKKKGFYLEIGAYHPTRLSNTYRFYKNGWRGVVVEPNPETEKIFIKLRAEDNFVNKGVGIIDGKLDYYVYDIPALNTFSAAAVKENKSKGFRYSEIKKIDIIDINKLLRTKVKNKIDLLSLDVEGWDKLILKNWDWSNNPKVICVEGKVDDILYKKGYVKIGMTKNNSIFVFEKSLP